MGPANSPSLAGQYGTAFLRLLKTDCSLYQGTLLTMRWWKSFDGIKSCDSSPGQGRVLIGDNGLPASLVWSHCDAFYISRPTKEKIMVVLKAFLDKSMGVGILCHQGKLTTLSQSAKYTRDLLSTRPRSQRLSSLKISGQKPCP
jgi:hypothetical protein